MRLHHLAGALALAWLTTCVPVRARVLTSVHTRPLDIVPARARMIDLVLEAARRHAVPAPLAYATAWTESRFDPGARSSAGAIGLMQIRPGTARDAGCRGALLEPHANADCGMRILAALLREHRGSWREAARHYNAGRWARAGVGSRYAVLVLKRARRFS